MYTFARWQLWPMAMCVRACVCARVRVCMCAQRGCAACVCRASVQCMCSVCVAGVCTCVRTYVCVVTDNIFVYSCINLPLQTKSVLLKMVFRTVPPDTIFHTIITNKILIPESQSENIRGSYGSGKSRGEGFFFSKSGKVREFGKQSRSFSIAKKLQKIREFRIR